MSDPKHKTIRVYDCGGRQLAYLSERLNNYPENELEFVKANYPNASYYITKEGYTLINHVDISYKDVGEMIEEIKNENL